MVGLVRYFAPILVAKHAAKYLNSGPASSITLTTGEAANKPHPGWAIVSGYCGALNSLTRALALDLKPIRVNLISPGAIDTELWNGMSEEQRKGFSESIAKTSATGVIGKAGDVAEAYLYAMKDRNVTGSIVSSNGGALLM
jgi:NAD(P)-dependent dehydrogenase (short-subunit alcohol dehydrogenase family)